MAESLTSYLLTQTRREDVCGRAQRQSPTLRCGVGGKSDNLLGGHTMHLEMVLLSDWHRLQTGDLISMTEGDKTAEIMIPRLKNPTHPSQK